MSNEIQVDRNLTTTLRDWSEPEQFGWRVVASVVTEAWSRYGLVLFGNVAQEYDMLTLSFCCPTINDYQIAHAVHIRHAINNQDDMVYTVVVQIAPALRRLAEVRDARQ